MKQFGTPNNLENLATHLKEDGFPDTDVMRSEINESDRALFESELDKLTMEYAPLFEKFAVNTISPEESIRFKELLSQIEDLQKKLALSQ